MPRSPKRQPRKITRTVHSLSLSVPEWTDANRAAGMVRETLSGFIREAVRRRVALTFAGTDPAQEPMVPRDAAA